MLKLDVFKTGGVSSFYHDGVEKEVEGPYAYLILGQRLRINKDKSFTTVGLYVVGVDLSLKLAVDSNFYYDIYGMPVDAIYEKHGKKMIDGRFGSGVVLNYDHVKFDSMDNVCCRDGDIDVYWDGYDEKHFIVNQLFSVVLSFDENKKECTGVGWDSLGKIVNEYVALPISEAFERLVCTDIYVDEDHYPGIDGKLLTHLGWQNFDIVGKKEIVEGFRRKLKVDWDSAKFKFTDYLLGDCEA